MAVKTLRASALQPDGLPPAELRDLLSELELLKDVEHPNVIRLLGACTDAAGPPCVLLEYCALGALRGYLHGCRWADDEAAAEAAAEKAAEAEQQQQQQRSARQRPFMTPRKIIGFAWQIAKGMDYLGQLKVSRAGRGTSLSRPTLRSRRVRAARADMLSRPANKGVSPIGSHGR